MTSCMEMTTFTLAPGADKAAFADAAKTITAWAAGQPGFQYRCLVDKGDEGWMDCVWWASAAEAEAAKAGFMAANADSPFMAMIDPQSVRMAHHPVAHMGMAA